MQATDIITIKYIQQFYRKHINFGIFFHTVGYLEHTIQSTFYG